MTKTNKECGRFVAGKNHTNLKGQIARQWHHQYIFLKLTDKETKVKRKREEDG